MDRVVVGELDFRQKDISIVLVLVDGDREHLHHCMGNWFSAAISLWVELTFRTPII